MTGVMFDAVCAVAVRFQTRPENIIVVGVVEDHRALAIPEDQDFQLEYTRLFGDVARSRANIECAVTAFDLADKSIVSIGGLTQRGYNGASGDSEGSQSV